MIINCIGQNSTEIFFLMKKTHTLHDKTEKDGAF